MRSSFSSLADVASGRAAELRAASAMCVGVRPYFTSRSSLGADSPKTSWMPTRFMGVGPCSPSVSATAPPSPPMTVCSSAVTTRPVFCGRGDDRLFVQGLERGHVQDVGADALSLEQLRRLHRAVEHDAGGHDRHIDAFADHHGFADLEVVVFPEDDRSRVSREPQIDGLAILGGREYRLSVPPRRRRGRSPSCWAWPGRCRRPELIGGSCRSFPPRGRCTRPR